MTSSILGLTAIKAGSSATQLPAGFVYPALVFTQENIAMKRFVLLTLILLPLFASAQDKDKKEPVTLRSILLEQLRTTHNNKDWFVDGNTAVAGLTAEQANWSDGKNHSVGQLAYHLVF